MDIYKHPQYYEIAFSFRDIAAEVDFMEEAIRQYSRVGVHRLLELASGNSPHMAELCRRGYQYIGLEASDEMIAYSRQKVAEGHMDAVIIKGDMVEFVLDKPADCAVVFLGSLYTKNDEELDWHLRSLADSVRPGGLYFLDGVVTVSNSSSEKQEWTESRNGITVTATYGPRWIDNEKKLAAETITLSINDHGEERTIQHTEIKGRYTAREFVSAAESTGAWEYAHACSNFDMKKGLEEGTRTMVILLRR